MAILHHNFKESLWVAIPKRKAKKISKICQSFSSLLLLNLNRCKQKKGIGLNNKASWLGSLDQAANLTSPYQGVKNGISPGNKNTMDREIIVNERKNVRSFLRSLLEDTLIKKVIEKLKANTKAKRS